MDLLYRPRALGGLYAGAGLGFRQWFWSLQHSRSTTDLNGADQPVYNTPPRFDQDVSTSGPRFRAILGFAPVPKANVELVLETGGVAVPNPRTLARATRTLTTLALTFGLRFPSLTRGR